MQIISEFIWEKNSRKINEDSLCICHVLFNGKPLLLAAICDGVGGMPDGESASTHLINNLKNTFNTLDRSHPPSIKRLSHIFNQCIYATHNEITSGATTLCMAVIYNNRCFIMSYGDSRCYIGTNKLSLITKDHSDSSGHLTQAIGTGQFYKPFKKVINLHSGMNILICSDGFYRQNHLFISHKNQFKSCTTEKDWKEMLDNMYCYAVNNGEKDNCSAIILSIRKD